MNKNFPKVSVVIPNYNHERYLPQRIESVLQQTYQDIEILLLDDCSPDSSRVVIEKYAAQDSRIHVVFNEHNSGSTFKQWNKAFALVRGQYIWIAESDDYADPSFLETLVHQLDKDSSIGLAYSNSATVDENNEEVNELRDFYLELDPELWKQDFVIDGRTLVTNFMSYRNIVPNASAVVIRKSAIDKVGKANEKFKVNGDWVFWASLMADTKVAFISKKLNYFRFHLNNARTKTLVKGIALSEMTSVLVEMQQYGKPNQVFLDKMIAVLNEMWFSAMVLNKIPIRTHIKIFNNMKKVNNRFNNDFFMNIKKYFIDNKLSGLRILLGDGLIYRLFKK